MKQKLRQWFSIQLVKNPGRVILGVILLFNIVFFLLSAAVISAMSLTGTEHMSFIEAAFCTLTMILDAGCIQFVIADIGEAGVVISVFCLLVVLVGMVSFTGSTRAGVDIAAAAAVGVKRVTQELGGKGPNIVLDDADFASNVGAGVATMMVNSGQTCSAGSRMLVPSERMAEAIDVAAQTLSQITVGDPEGDFSIGPVVSEAQFDKIQSLIQKGIDEGATLVGGGVGRPDGLSVGYYVQPTVFADVKNDMTIAREEIFGPVLTILGYDSIDHAVDIANDTEYGLAAFVAGADLEQARSVARRIRAGNITINGAFDFGAPFGGYKKSGNGREWGEFGFHDYLEIKAVIGYAAEDGAE